MQNVMEVLGKPYRSSLMEANGNIGTWRFAMGF